MCILLYCCFLYEHREGQCLSLVMCSVVMYCCIVVLLLFYVNIVKLIYSWCDCPTIFGVGERCVLPTLKLSVIFPLNMVGLWRQTCHTHHIWCEIPTFFFAVQEETRMQGCLLIRRRYMGSSGDPILLQQSGQC